MRKSYFENGKVKNLVCCLNISDAQHYMSLLTGSNQNSMYGEDKTISESRTQILPCNDNLQPRKERIREEPSIRLREPIIIYHQGLSVDFENVTLKLS